MSDQELHFEPMSTGMVLDKSFRLYIQNFALMIGLTAIVHIPILFLSVGVPILGQSNSSITTVALLLGTLASLASSLIVAPLVTGAATKAVSDRYLGNPTTIRAALKTAWGSIGTLLLTQIIVGIIVLVGLLLLVVPGILWMLSYALVAPVTILEETADRQHIRERSWDLVKGNRGKVFVVMLVIIVTQLLLSGAGELFISFIFESTSNSGMAMSRIVGGVAGMLTYPLQAIAVTLLYYDFRIRKEGFDLEMLSRALGNPLVQA